MSAGPPTSALDALETTLVIERELLQSLLFKLTQAKLVLASGESRFVGPAIEEVASVMQTIRGAEDKRSAAVAQVAAEWGVPSASMTLAYVADNVPPDRRDRFSALRYEFMDLTEEIEKITRENERLAAGNLSVIQGTISTLHQVTEVASGYDARGQLPSKVKPVRFDRSV
jgi:hypothetical protein